jgi:hypothetical protein
MARAASIIYEGLRDQVALRAPQIADSQGLIVIITITAARLMLLLQVNGGHPNRTPVRCPPSVNKLETNN